MIFCIPCLMLILYFLILSIFIPRYRPYIKAGWKCFKDKIRGNKCNLTFDGLRRRDLSYWLLSKDMNRLGVFIGKERNFNIVLILIFIIFTLLSSYLFWLLIKFLFIASPCDVGKCM